MDRVRQIDMVVRAANAGSFAKAAASLNLTPSAVSHAVADLEKDLRTTLFYRTTRQLRLTEDGEEFCRRGREILEKLTELEAAAMRAPARAGGKLRIGLGTSIARHIIMPRLPDFMRWHPELAIECRLRLHVKDMHAEAIDVLLRVGEPPDSAVIARKLGRVRFAIYGAPSYLGSAGVPTHPRDLARHRCLIFNPVGWATKPLDTWNFQRGAENEVVKLAQTVVSDEREGLFTAAVAGGGLIRAGLFDPAIIASGQLKRVLDDWSCSGAPSLYAIYRKTQRTSPKVAAFLDFAEQATTAFDPEELTLIHNSTNRQQPPTHGKARK
jgi:LysR family transcriptional regulator, regulator for bpeEF and oprC